MSWPTIAHPRSERLAKYNQLLRIEEELGTNAKYAGANFRKVALTDLLPNPHLKWSNNIRGKRNFNGTILFSGSLEIFPSPPPSSLPPLPGLLLYI